jgi:Fe-S-cluster containining protein
MDDCKLSGVCCRLFYINLDEEEYKSKKFRTQFEEFGFIEDFEEAQEYGANVLSKNEDGSCIYLKENLCSIHDSRPKVCRKFFCNSTNPKFQDMIRQVNEEKTAKGIPINEP